MKRKKFQSTSPYAGDDYTTTSLTYGMINFNPRPPTRGTTQLLFGIGQGGIISIHVPLRGGRLAGHTIAKGLFLFQSTSPYAGDDRSNGTIRATGTQFQSTSPYAGDDTSAA